MQKHTTRRTNTPTRIPRDETIRDTPRDLIQESTQEGRILKNKILTILLLIIAGMMIWDFSLHLVELLKAIPIHPLYPHFNSHQQYEIFWTTYWGIASLLTIITIKITIRKPWRTQQ
jgi:hypothetical protein